MKEGYRAPCCARGELRGRELPKWPMMLVTGVPVTPDQAKEIIRRNDVFFTGGWGGNDHKWDERAAELLKMPYDSLKPYEERDYRVGDWHEIQRRDELWREQWGAVRTEYVYCNWVSCTYISGPYGWCHPDGQIGYVDNVGKWPTVADIEADWTILLNAFPFINVGVTLFDQEHIYYEGKYKDEVKMTKIVSLRVREGEVTLIDPINEDVHLGHPKAVRREGDDGFNDEEFMKLRFGSHDGGLAAEHGIPWQWIEDWARRG